MGAPRRKPPRWWPRYVFNTASVREIPIDVSLFAGEVDVEVRVGDLPKNVAAFLLHRPRASGVIIVNSAHPPRRRRFSAAHELGHYLYGPGERAANAFAATFLMPKPVFISLWGDYHREPSPSRIRLVATRLDVSPRAAAIRAEELKLTPGGTVWTERWLKPSAGIRIRELNLK